MAVIKLKPSFKDYLWGGTKLKDKYQKDTNLKVVAESWEISTHPDGESIIDSGVHRGLTLSKYIELRGKAILGSKANKFEQFPLLVKLIDAKNDLSIQVHPDDEDGFKYENESGKTEMWYILEAKPNATIYYGLNQNIDKTELKQRIKNNTLLEVLNEVKVEPNDVYYVEAGTIHAIGAGIVLCEIQQNSNLTYRVFDYNRKDTAGNLRELHIEKAVQVSNTNQLNVTQNLKRDIVATTDYTRETLINSRYFKTQKITLKDQFNLMVNDESFFGIVVTQGKINVTDNISLTLGETAFIEANSGEIHLQGSGEFLLVSL